MWMTCMLLSGCCLTRHIRETPTNLRLNSPAASLCNHKLGLESKDTQESRAACLARNEIRALTQHAGECQIESFSYIPGNKTSIRQPPQHNIVQMHESICGKYSQHVGSSSYFTYSTFSGESVIGGSFPASSSSLRFNSPK